MPLRQLSSYEKRAAVTLLLMALSLPFMGWAAVVSFQNTLNSPVSWLPNESVPRQQLVAFAEEFRTEDMIVVSWEGCTLDDPRLPQFAEAVSSRSDGELEATNLAGTVLDGFHAVERLIYDVELSREEAVERLQGLLVGRDGKTSCALLPTRYRSNDYRDSTITFVMNATREAGIPDSDVHLAGAFVEGAAIDEASAKSFKLFVAPSIVMVSLICWMCLRSWKLSAAVLSVAGFAGGSMIAVLPPLNIQLNAVLVVMAPLLMVLTVSAGVHLVNYYLDEWRKHYTEGPRRDGVDPVRAALAAGWWPCVFCTLTTAIGMGSLTLSEIVPVRQFGALTALAVMASLALLLLVLPGAMYWHLRTAKPPTARVDGKQRWGLAMAVTRRAWAPIVVLGLCMMMVGGFGVSQVKTSVSVMNLLNDHHWLVKNYHWLEERLGPLVPIEVLVRFDGKCELDDVERLQVVQNVEEAMYDVEQLGSVFSGATFLPYIPADSSFQSLTERTVLRRRMPEIKQQLRSASWMAGDNAETWRISARVPAFGDENYDELMTHIKQSVSHAVANEMIDGLSVSFTGLAPVVSHAQNMLLDDLFRSLVAAVGLVALVLTIVFRSVRAGLLAMIPNVFPSLLLFGGMGLLGFPVDIGTVMTASVALGIAVDDTIHYLTWFRRQQQITGSRPAAIQSAFSHSAVAMMQTTAVCGLGLAPFVMADFVPTAQFAWMMIALLALAIIGDLILLPALLTSPLGRAFESSSPSTPSTPGPATETAELPDSTAVGSGPPAPMASRSFVYETSER
ncbi:MAG: MMPL family transporter [Planctomycetales bacterium]|nr:MMPL family transporter [Planctomycetales bacterium]